MLWLALTMALATCPDPEVPLGKAEQQLLEFELDAATASLEQVVEGLACAEPVSSEVHRRYWLTRGVLWSYQEDPRRTEAFAASKLREEAWNQSFGPTDPDAPDAPPSVYNQWRVAVAPATSFTLELKPLPSTAELWIDGLAQEDLASIPAGAHLIQVGDHAGMYFARDLLVRGDTALELPIRNEPSAPEPSPGPAAESVAAPAAEPGPAAESVAAPAAEPGPAAEPAVAEAPTPEPETPIVVQTDAAVTAHTLALPTVKPKKRGHASRGLLVSGLVLGTIGAVGVGAAAVTKQAYLEDGTDSDGLYYANLGTGAGGYGLVGVGTLLFGTSFVVNRW